MKKFILALAISLLAMIGFVSTASATEVCVPQDAYSEVIAGTPAVEAVYEYVVKTPEKIQRYSYKGKWDSSDAPAFPGDRWQANVEGDPHNVRFENSGAYFISHGNSGKGDWFYIEITKETGDWVLVSEAIPAVEDVVIEHEAVVCAPEVIPETPVEEEPEVVIPPVVDEEPPVEQPQEELPVVDIPVVVPEIVEEAPITAVPVVEAPVVPMETPKPVQVVKDVTVPVAAETASYPELAYTGMENGPKMLMIFGAAIVLIAIGWGAVRLTRQK